MVAIVDSHSPPVLGELEEMVTDGRLQRLAGGGLRHTGQRPVVLLLGCEVEVHEDGVGPVHYLAYFPNLETARGFSGFLAPRVTNLSLSSQRARATGEEVALWLRGEGGFMVPAHIFTPHRGFFGQGGTDLRQCLSDRALETVPAVELGLSEDTRMAEHVPSLQPFVFLSNSDAHSPETIGREHNLMALGPPEAADFETVATAVRGGEVVANYGLDPRLGKYHRAVCRRCGATPETPEGHEKTCAVCGSSKMTGGVLDRAMELARRALPQSPGPAPGGGRPPYVHHIPLLSVPGVGPVTYRRLLEEFGTEMRVLHETTLDELAAVVGSPLAARLRAAGGGTAELHITPGGGGRYGRVRRHVR